MKIKNIMLSLAALLLAVTLTGCLSDDGNYDYRELEPIEISSVPEVARFVLHIPQTISPVITTNVKNEDLEYIWRIGSDTLCNTKDFNYTFTSIPTKSDLIYEVRNMETDVRYSKVIDLTVVSPFTTGWLVLTNDNGKSHLAFQSFEDKGELFQDVYQYVNGSEMTGTPRLVKQIRYQDGNTGGWVDRVSVINNNGKSPELNGVSMMLSYNYEDQFKSDCGNIMYINSEQYRQDYSVILINDRGEMYCKVIGSMGSSEDGYFTDQYAKDDLGYEMTPLLARCYGQYFGLDKKNHRFVTFIPTYMTTPVSDPFYGTSVVDTDSFPGELVWIGCTMFEYNGFYAVMKNGGKYYLYSFTYGYDYSIYALAAKVTNCTEFPAGVVAEDSKFQLRNDKNYIFVTNGNDLKAVNMTSLESGKMSVENIATYDGKILDMQYLYDNTASIEEFGIAIDGGNNTTSLLVIDPVLANHGAILKRFDGIKGKAVSICRKY